MKLSKISKKHNLILNKLEELYEEEHGGCEESTCSMQVAFEHGYTIHALDCFASSGAASDEYYALWNKIPRKLKDAYSRYEAELLCKEISNAECSYCNAVSWQIEYLKNTKGEIYCGSCAKYFIEQKVS